MTAPPSTAPVLLAVNGTLMRGLELNPNLLAVGGTFLHEARTAPVYRLWSINDSHPAMVRVKSGGAAVELEIWAVPPDGLAALLLSEPPGLSIGKVKLADGSEVLGILGEPVLCENQAEITRYGGWRGYVQGKQGAKSKIQNPNINVHEPPRRRAARHAADAG